MLGAFLVSAVVLSCSVTVPPAPTRSDEVAAAGDGPGSPVVEQEAVVFPVMPGVDVLASQGFAVLRDKRVGLLTHDAAATREGEPTWSVFYRAPEVNLVALFSAEHGIDGKAPASAIIDDEIHGPTGVPIYSLYGRTRHPPADRLALIDVLVVDLQGIGSRSYTFISAMREALKAAFVNGVEAVVLDRPNPLGGVKVDGPMVDPELRSYVGAFPVPYVHGLTMGELARMALEDPGVLELEPEVLARARLTVVPMRGWKRSMRWPETGLPWRATSPYIQDFAAVEGYAITGLGCILGGWTHGVGRDHPFRGLYYPGKSAAEIAGTLNDLHVPGIAVRKIELTNDKGKQVHGAVVDIVDWDALRPTELSFHLMRLACAWSAGNPFRAASGRERQSFNRHVGSRAWWDSLVRDGAKVDVEGFIQRWEEQAQAFREKSRRFWLYPDDENNSQPVQGPVETGDAAGPGRA